MPLSRPIVSWGRSLGDVLSDLMTATDSVAVIGGGVAGARALFMPAALEEMRSRFASSGVARLWQRVYDLDNEAELNEFLKGDVREAKVPFSDKTVLYDAALRLGCGILENRHQPRHIYRCLCVRFG